jgi:hypothetical protein
MGEDQGRALGDHEEGRLTGRHHAAESLRQRPPSPGYVGVVVSDRRAIVELYTGAISGWLGAHPGCTPRASGGRVAGDGARRQTTATGAPVLD